MSRLRFLPTLATALLILVGCDTPATITPQRNQLENAPTQVRVAGHDLVLDAYVGRDFMPIAPPDGHPVDVVVYLHDAAGGQHLLRAPDQRIQRSD